jgi:uracil DNA glycosylase
MYKQKQWEEWLHEELEKPYMIKLVGDLEKEAYKMELAPLREYWFNSL